MPEENGNLTTAKDGKNAQKRINGTERDTDEQKTRNNDCSSEPRGLWMPQTVL
ncbi:hypothetical protein COOONC_18494 [Cooperia oncophora]